VDDDESWRRLIKGRLGDHTVDSAESMQRAIELLESGVSYDVALVDLNLETDSDRQGGELLDLMRIRYPRTRRILVTGSPPAGSVRRNVFERYDVEEIIIKRDMEMPDLRRAVEEAVAQGPGGPPQSLRLSRSALRQRFRDWQSAQADRLKNEIRVADERLRDAAKGSEHSMQRAETAVEAAKKREAEFRSERTRLRKLLENIENAEQLSTALEAAEDQFAEDPVLGGAGGSSQAGEGLPAPGRERRPATPADVAERADRPRVGRTMREPAAARPSRDSQALPEPDPAEAQSSVGGKAADYAVGDFIDDRFEILDILGRGGFSKVYQVRDDVEDEERALKLFDSAAGYAAVRREIGALRKIRHPNVVEVFWAGKTSDGDWYLVTEFIDGESLNDFVTGDRHLRDREAVDVALDLLDALVAIHPDAARLKQLDAQRRAGELSEAELHEWMELSDKGLVHRDIKPLNVILTRTGAKLLDFNIASRVGDPVRTQSGTPPYQPPDADLTRWDVSTDLFAVGVVLYQLLCKGQHPYPNAMPMVDEPVTDPRGIRPDLNPGLAEFLSKACAPVGADRFSTAAEMQLALREVRAGL
jgi:CheY-like chemotaxis protein